MFGRLGRRALRPRPPSAPSRAPRGGNLESTYTARAREFTRRYFPELATLGERVRVRRDAWFYVKFGAVCGAGFSVLVASLLVKYQPKRIEDMLVANAVRAFNGASSWEAKRVLFLALPEAGHVNISTDIAAVAAAQTGREDALSSWASMVSAGFAKLDAQYLISAKTRMRKMLLDEAMRDFEVEAKFDAIRDLMPPSIERNVAIEEIMLDVLKKESFIPAHYLEENQPAARPIDAFEYSSKMLIAAIAFFPGPIKVLADFLENDADLVTTLRDLDLASQDAQDALLSMWTTFTRLSNPELKTFVLHQALTTAIEHVQGAGAEGRALYERAVDDHLLGPLRRDADMPEHVLLEAKKIYLALPAPMQARIMLAAVRHPFVRASKVTPAQQAAVVRDLLSAGGVVSVKLAQSIAEDPRVPLNYKNLMRSLRDDNEPMHFADWWWSVPATVRKEMAGLGRILGTGSVKQVHVVKFHSGKEWAVGALRKNVEDEALASVTALESSDELGSVARRLGRIVYNEFNLFSEGEALGEFSATSIGQSELFRVVRVVHHSPHCLVEEIADGPTIADVLDNEDTDPTLRKRVLNLLVEYHRAVFDAFADQGLIHSDVHLANAALDYKDDGSLGFVLFDVGQFERISRRETYALLWILGSMTTVGRRSTMRSLALDSMSHVCSLHVDAVDDATKDDIIDATSLGLSGDVFTADDPVVRKKVRAKLETAYKEAIAPLDDGTYPDPRACYLLFLRACEKRGVVVPHGSFSLAKMVDCLLSQMNAYALPHVVEEKMSQYLRSHMSFGEGTTYALKNVTDYVFGNDIPPAHASTGSNVDFTKPLSRHASSTRIREEFAAQK